MLTEKNTLERRDGRVVEVFVGEWDNLERDPSLGLMLNS